MLTVSDFTQAMLNVEDAERFGRLTRKLNSVGFGAQ